MATDAVNILKETPAVQTFSFVYGKGSPSRTGTTASSGSKSRLRTSSFVASDRILPTAYSTARQTMGGYTIRTQYYRDGYRVKPGGIVKLYYTTYRQEGPETSVHKAFHESSPFGIFRMYLSTNQAFMALPSKYIVPLHNKLLEKIDDQSVDIGTMIAELRGTVKFATSVVKPLAEFGMSIISGRYSKAVKKFGIPKRRWDKFNKWVKKKDLKSASLDVTGHVASRWTEFNFAVKPSIKDLSDMASLWNTPEKVLGRVKMRASTSLTIHDEHFYPSPSSSYQNDNDRKILDGSVRAVAVYSVTSPETVAQKALGLNNLPSAAYNAVPFSWLVDYVFNVGDFLSLVTATEGLSFKHGYTSGKFSEQSFVDRRYENYDNPPLSQTTVYNSQSFTEGYVREILINFPRPLVQLVLPDLTLRQASLAASVGFLLKRSAIKVGHY